MSGVVVDLQGVQSRSHAERGIARYLTSLALELDTRHRESVESFVLNPELPTPRSLEHLQASGRLGYPNHALCSEASAFHIGSLVELETGLDRLWPAGMRRLPLMVTLYDLIPEIFADHYLTDPGLRRRYRTRLQLLHTATRVLAISEATARDAVTRLGLAPNRVVPVGAGVSDHFRPPADHEAAVKVAVEQLPFVRPGFILYTGGIEFRKNIDRLLVGYAALSKRLRNQHQLVIVCRVASSMRPVIEARLAELGLSDHVVFPGVVAESDLVLLYQAAELFVFPSLYEGFGLPVAEAMACGAPVLAARTSSLLELVDDEDALFEPTQPGSIAAALRQALGDAELRARLRARGLDRSWRWSSVADRTAEVYEDVARGRKAYKRPRPRIAFVSPLPPQLSGVADYSYRLLTELADLVEVDVFTDFTEGPSRTPEDLPLWPTRTLMRVEGARGGYNEVLACLGNSHHHAETLALLRRRPSAVLAHDVRLTGLYTWISNRRRELDSRGFQDVLHELHPGRLPPDLGERGQIDFHESERYGVLMVREAIARSTEFLVHSPHAAELARQDADPEDAAKIRVVSFGYPEPSEHLVNDDATLVSTFGIVDAIKQTERIVEAVALVPRARLAIVGPASGEESHRVAGVIDRLGVADKTTVTGELPPKEFHEWMARTDVAVQLRAASNGESSASLADCLASGVPTIATELGSTKDLPDDVYVPVGQDVTPHELAETIDALLADPARRAALSANGRRHAQANSFAHAARSIVDELFGQDAAFRRAA